MIEIYSEYLIEWDSETLMVYVSGLTSDNYWEEIKNFDDANDVEDFANGYAEALRMLGAFVTVIQSKVG